MAHSRFVHSGPPPRRLNPRRRTLLKLLGLGAEDPLRVVNVSTTGMFVRGARGDEPSRGSLWIPGGEGPLELRYRPVHRAIGGLGMAFEDLRRDEKAKLQAYVGHQREADRLRHFESRIGLAGQLNLKPLSQSEWPDRVMRPLAKSQAEIQIFSSVDATPLPANVATLDEVNARLTVMLRTNPREALPGEFDEIFLVVRDGGAWYLADTIVEHLQSGLATIMLPERLYLPERRALVREAAGDAEIVLAIGSDAVRGKVLELDANGLSVLVPVGVAALLRVGDVLPGAMLVSPSGERHALESIRVAWRASRQEGGAVRFGMQRILERVEIAPFPIQLESKVGSAFQEALQRASWLAGKAAEALRLGVIGLGPRVPQPQVWDVRNAKDQGLRALVNATFDLSRPPAGPIHVVLVPPPFARKKEVLSPVALALVETFRNAGAHAVVVRWDGINHLGESHHTPRSAHPDLQMLDWKLSQCVQDLADMHRAARERWGDGGKTAIVSFSLAAVATRRYLAEGGAGVDYWIAPMGAPDPRDIIANSSGGIDWVGDRKRGRNLGPNLIQGWLVDCDQGCDDMIQARMSELEDGRRDMQAIPQPVTWICGEHDYWVNERRVQDILSVKAPGPRELIRVPTGHFVRTSTEAVAAFRLVAGRVAGHLLGRTAPGRTPTAFVLQRAAELERARLKQATFDAQSYWAGYLQGTKQNPLGFDLLSLTDEYQELMTDQVAALALRPGERLADIGCGTGNGIEAVVQEYGRRCPGLRIDGVDFVPDALRHARAKFDEAASRLPQAPDATFHRCDLALPAEAPNLPFGDGTFDAILVGLVIPYLESPANLLREIARILRPGGRVVISSLRPDVDMSGPLRRLREKVLAGDDKLVEGWDKRMLLAAIQDYIHAAARLVDQEHEGRFHFYEKEELEGMLRRAGLVVSSTTLTFGNPKLGLVSTATRPSV